MDTTVYTVQIALPSAEAMKQFYSLMHAAEAAEDRWSRETGTEMLERMFNGDLNDDEYSFFSACWNILINTGDFARLLCAYTTMEATFQDPGVDHVAFKPSLVQLIEDAELLPVVAEAYAEALADRDSWQAKALATGKRKESLKTNNVTDGKPVTGNSPVIPDGWKLVPNELTTKQWAAGYKAMDGGSDKVTLAYRAMVEVAPSPGGADDSHATAT